jgi:hypothetical protein
VVGSAVPFHWTVELEINPVPVAVKASAALPAVAEVGLRLVSVGAGFGGGLMLKARLLETPPPGAGFCTVMAAVPDAVRSETGICAVIDVLDT